MIRCKLIESENAKNAAGFDQSYMNLAGYPITTKTMSKLDEPVEIIPVDTSTEGGSSPTYHTQIRKGDIIERCSGLKDTPRHFVRDHGLATASQDAGWWESGAIAGRREK